MPKFSEENDGSKIERAARQPIGLGCPAQGSPVPSFRCILLLVEFGMKQAAADRPTNEAAFRLGVTQEV